MAEARGPAEDTRGKEIAALLAEEQEAQRVLEAAAVKAYPDLMDSAEGRAYRQSHGSSEDIVVRTRQVAAESSRAHDVTVSHLVKGAKLRQRIEKALRRRAEKEIEKERAKSVLASLRERNAIEARVAALRAAPGAALAALSPLHDSLVVAKALCAAHHARLVVLALPIDVEVSADEWAKYGREPMDVSALRVLSEDLVATAASLSIEAVDVREALAAAEPGAFLKGDLHLSPAGHRAVASALAATLRAPARQGREQRAQRAR
jgi:hypothetical protein